MDPVTITALAALVSKGIGMISNYQASVWSAQGWHGLTGEQKMSTIHQILEVAFSKARETQTSPKDIFWNITLQNIYRPAEKNYDTFISKNPWIVTDANFVPAYEKKYGFSFNAIPEKKSIKDTLDLFADQKTLIIGASAIVLLIILFVLFK